MLMSSLLAALLLAPSHASRQTMTWSRNRPATSIQKASDKRQRPRLARGINPEPRSLWRIKRYRP